MNTLKINAIALALGLAFSTGAMAQSMSKDDYKAGKEQIASAYKLDKAGCTAFSGNAKDICVAEAKGKEKVAIADLDASYKPTRKTHYQARVAKAEADYAVAKERCDDAAGNTKDVCVKEAKAAETTAKANAKARMKSSEANDKADETSSEARSKANSQVIDARKDASADKLDAQYDVAKEKCAAFAGSTKDQCLTQAKTNFGK